MSRKARVTTPALAQATDIGRLYRLPTTDPATLPPAAEALKQGLLLPSVTNVIDVFNKPYLQTWYAKRAAEDAVTVNKTHPGLMEGKPYKAIAWLKDAALRSSGLAAGIGDTVHNLVEDLARGLSPVIPDEVSGYVHAWEQFVTDFQPEFLHLEATCYGTVNGLGYAGTADFIARINGKVLVGDYKTGKSVHTEAALQLAALAHAESITNDDHTDVTAMPVADGGIVLHLTSTGYRVHPVDVSGGAWDAFGKARELWDFHQANLASRDPLFVASPVHSPDQLPF